MDTTLRQLIIPKDEQEWLNLRTRAITSTEIAALFNVSPYITAFELWHRKKNREIVILDPNERMEWGTALQDSIAHKVAEKNGWKIRRMEEYIRIPELRIGASFDFSIEETKNCSCGHSILDHVPKENDSLSYRCGVHFKCDCREYKTDILNGLLEIKNVDSIAFRNGWIVEDDNIEAPPHIELQVQHQLAVSGRSFAYIGALVGGNNLKLIRREPDEKIITEIKRRALEFWSSIESDKPPSPDFSRDVETISRIYGYAEPGKVKDVRGDEQFVAMMSKYKKALEDEKDAKKRKEAVKGEVLMLIGDAEKVIGDGFNISVGVIGPCHVEYDRDGYRNFKPTFKKDK